MKCSISATSRIRIWCIKYATYLIIWEYCLKPNQFNSITRLITRNMHKWKIKYAKIHKYTKYLNWHSWIYKLMIVYWLLLCKNCVYWFVLLASKVYHWNILSLSVDGHSSQKDLIKSKKAISVLVQTQVHMAKRNKNVTPSLPRYNCWTYQPFIWIN